MCCHPFLYVSDLHMGLWVPGVFLRHFVPCTGEREKWVLEAGPTGGISMWELVCWRSAWTRGKFSGSLPSQTHWLACSEHEACMVISHPSSAAWDGRAEVLCPLAVAAVGVLHAQYSRGLSERPILQIAAQRSFLFPTAPWFTCLWQSRRPDICHCFFT